MEQVGRAIAFSSLYIIAGGVFGVVVDEGFQRLIPTKTESLDAGFGDDYKGLTMAIIESVAQIMVIGLLTTSLVAAVGEARDPTQGIAYVLTLALTQKNLEKRLAAITTTFKKWLDFDTLYQPDQSTALYAKPVVSNVVYNRFPFMGGARLP